MHNLLPLRDYQAQAIKGADSKFAQGLRRVAIVLPTGGGKTVVFAHKSKSYTTDNPGKRVLILAHTDELVRQAAKKIKDVAPHLSVGIVKGPIRQTKADVVVASVQSLRDPKKRNQIQSVGLVIVDECFPAGTLVGDKKIEDLRPGDLVPSWDENTGEVVYRPVVALMSKTPSAMVRVTFDDGTSITCTPNHPLLTDAGWNCAGLLQRDDSVVSFTHDATAIGDVRGVRERFHVDTEKQDRLLAQVRADLLHRLVPGHVGQQGQLTAMFSDESRARIGENEAEESDAQRGYPRKDVCHIEADRASTEDSRRQWHGTHRAATSPLGGVELAYGGHDHGRGWAATCEVQRGHSERSGNGDSGSGRGIPFLAGAPITRSSQGRTPRLRRVVDVEVLESGSDGTYGGVCPDGAVYNIEVAGTHTYLVSDGVVAHNCHHATAKTYTDILRHYGALGGVCEACAGAGEFVHGRCADCDGTGQEVVDGALALGFTATLMRSDKTSLAKVWQEVGYRKDLSFMIRARYLIPPRGKQIVVTDLDLSRVKKSGGDFQVGDLGETIQASLAPEAVAKAYVEHARDRSGILFAPTVESAYAFAEELNVAGIKTEVVHGALKIRDRNAILARLESGETQVIANCMVLTEGFDCPRVSCVVVARPTKSSPLYQQMVGRGLRIDPTRPYEEQDCLVLDVVGISGRHTLASLVDLSDEPEWKKVLCEGDPECEEKEEVQEEEISEGIFGPDEVLNGPTVALDFDLLANSKVVWMKTKGGIYFLSAGTALYVFVLPSTLPDAEPGTFDVIWCTKDANSSHDGKRMAATDHRGLSRDIAFAWGEDVAGEMGGIDSGTLMNKSASWRKDKHPSEKQLTLCRQRRIEVPEGATKSQVSELIDTYFASKRIDPIADWAARVSTS